jgi:signal transduction histidine kinase
MEQFYRHEYAIPFDDSILNKSNLDIIQYLKEHTILFKNVDDKVIEQLVPLSSIDKYYMGDKILVEDKPNNRIFFLMRGEIGIYKQGDHILRLQRKGDIFGEMSLISNKPASASVICETEVEVFSINVRDMSELGKIDEKIIKDTLYKLYAVILADKLAITTFKAIGLEKKVQERTLDLERNNEKLEIAKTEAERANQAKSQFLSNMTHELRTPMHHILSFAHIGMKHFKSARDRTLECFQQVISSSNSMMEMVNDLLDLSELDTGRTKYTFAPYDISVIIREMVTGFSQQLEDKNISVEINQTDISTNIICDTNRISQVVHNILQNSIQFAPKGSVISICLEASHLAADSKNNNDSPDFSLSVSFKDEGPGIPENELDFIFDKFIQSSTTRTGAGGTGLGLAICQEIVRAHSGKIWAENNPDSGAVFSFLLPYVQV